MCTPVISRNEPVELRTDDGSAGLRYASIPASSYVLLASVSTLIWFIESGRMDRLL